MASPSDVRGLQALFDDGSIAPREVVAVLAKSEGNGGRNDFTRELAVRAFADAIGARTGEAREAVEARVVLSVSGGCEGVASPHAVVLGRREASAPAPTGPRLALAVGRTRAFTPVEIGTRAQVDETARALRALIADLGVGPADVHLAHVKAAIAGPEGAAARCDMLHARAASALGVAAALGEIDGALATDAAIARDFSLSSSVASVSAKPGLAASEIFLLASSTEWGGDLVVDHGVMSDPIDAASVRAVLARLGVEGDPARVVGAFAKAEAHPSRRVRGLRHVMLDDDDVGDTRWARAAVAAVVASAVGHTAVYVSTRAEHMGPLGGGPLTIIARTAS
ncbi:MAG TPA: ring-opening amidohydrolase [Byssovorax sp.]